MLPRISAALAQLIQPIASASTQAGAQSFQKFKPVQVFQPPAADQEKKEAPEQQMQEQPGDREREPEGTPEPKSEPLSANPAPASRKTAAQSVIEMIARFQAQRLTLMRWLGVKTYSETLKRQKKTLHFKKGAMLDQKNG